MLPLPFNLLLLEDDRDDEELALRALRESGLPLCVRVARDGECALRVLGLTGCAVAIARMPDLVLSDYKMPKVDGPEVLRLMRGDEGLCKVPFVVLSSSDDTKGIDRCLALGASAYHVKPIDFDGYLACVREIPRRWLGPRHD